MKKRLIATILLVAVVFSGCSYNQTGIEGLMAPPKLSDQQNEIYNALVTSVGKNIKLKYPRQGSFTSAFLINNIDDEPTQEAIVFYENTSNASAEQPLTISVLDQEDGKWVAKHDVRVSANEVDKISFIMENKQNYIVIGFNVLSKSEQLIMMYTYEDGLLSKKFTTNCSSYEVFDIDDDKSSEILTFVQKTGEGEIKTMTANMHKINSGGTSIVSEAAMDPNVSEYAKIHKGKLSDGRPALYLDGIKGTNNLCTEILSYENGGIANLIYSNEEEENLVPKTVRAYGSFCVDLGDDGVFEIPTIKPALGFENLQQFEQLFFTEWYNFRNGNLKLVKTAYVAYSKGYIFTIPRKWIDKVSVEVSLNSNELTFYEYERKGSYDERLMSIKVVKHANYVDEALSKGYTMLEDKGQLLYTYKLHETTSKLQLTPGEVEAYFDTL